MTKLLLSRWLRYLGIVACFVGLFLVVSAIGIYLYCKPRYELAQSFDLKEVGQMNYATIVYDENGMEFCRFFAQNRVHVALSDTSPHFRNAIIAGEDPNFNRHGGTDLGYLFRTFFNRTQPDSMPPKGNSTITQKLVRITFEMRDRTFSRKVTEMFLARRLEKAFSKEEILELYINRLYYGDGCYGLDTASFSYFAKSQKDLTIAEAATLAAMVRNPKYLSPRNYPDLSMHSRNEVIKTMHRMKMIQRTERDSATGEPIRVVDPIEYPSGGIYDTIRKELQGLVGKKLTEPGGYRVQSKLPSNSQFSLQSHLISLTDPKGVEIQFRKITKKSD